MSWVKVTHELPDKPEVIQMAEILGIEQDLVVGKLIRFWIWCDQQLHEDGDASGVTLTFADRLTTCNGFGNALLRVGWAVVTEGGISIPNFDRHLSETAKRRALTKNRTTKYREKSDASSVTNVTQAASRKRYGNVTAPLQRKEEKERERKEEREEERKKVTQRKKEEEREEKREKEREKKKSSEIDELVATWNRSNGVCKCRNLSPERRKKLLTRFKDPAWPWREALTKFPLKVSQRTDGQDPWIPDFEWFLRPGSALAIVEGKYDFTPSGGKPNRRQFDPSKAAVVNDSFQGDSPGATTTVDDPDGGEISGGRNGAAGKRLGWRG